MSAAAIREASALQGPLKSTSDPVLYTHVLCPYAQRAWLALLEKGVNFETVNVDLSKKPSWYPKLHPLGQVPAIDHQGSVVIESLDICKWADNTFEGPDLGSSRHEVQQLVAKSNSFASAGLSFLAGRTGRSWGIGSGQSESQRVAFQQQISSLEKCIEQSGGPFLCGAQPTLADIAYYPFAERFAVGMPVFCQYDVRNSSHDLYVKWLSAMGERKSVQTSSANPDLLLQAFKNHKSLDFFDYDTYEATALHPHLA